MIMQPPKKKEEKKRRKGSPTRWVEVTNITQNPRS